jgi:8-hydroxy-5-deazaflavin:NADPH oxidoreductase
VRIAIIGTGAIGGTLARKFSAAGYDVVVANSRGPETIDPEVLEFGARAAAAAEAVQGADAVILSIPFARIPAIAGLLSSAAPRNAVVIDTSNYFPHRDGQIGAVENGGVESEWVAEQLGRPVVKAWNAALASTLQTKGVPAGTAGRVALPVAADSDEARRVGLVLMDVSGFDPFDAGSLADSWRFQPGTPAYCTELEIGDLADALASADRATAPSKRDRSVELVARQTSPTPEDILEAKRVVHQ